MENSQKEHRLGDIIAHWNVEHTPEERHAHLRWAQGFLKETGLDRMMQAKLTRPSVCWLLGYPHTGLDIVLKEPYRNRVYRDRKTRARIVNLSVFHLSFARTVGVYDFNTAQNEVSRMIGSCKSAADAARISAWEGWEGSVCECTLRTDARSYGYRCRNYSGYDGDPGDSFTYGADWESVHSEVAGALYRIVDRLGLRQVSARTATGKED